MQRKATPLRARRRPHHVVMLSFERAQVLDVTGPLEVFSRTSRWLVDHARHTQPAYRIELVAPRAGPVTMSSGLQLLATRSYRDVRSADTLLVSGGVGYENAARDPQILEWLRFMAPRVSRYGSICTGALVLAHAGLLDGKSVTTHWAYCDRLSSIAPRAAVQADALYVRSGRLYTSAGVTAGMDMALGIVEQDWGRAVALSVAQELVMYLKRPGGQSQFSRQLEAQKRSDPFGELQLWMLENLGEDLSVGQLAQRMNMSTRHFARCFAQQMGATPSAFVRRLRVEEARRRIEEGAARLKDVARRCGFEDEQAMRRSFSRILGTTPVEYRERFGTHFAS